MIAIIDYDMGNLGSIKNILKKIGVKSIITRDPRIIRESDAIILPGVGSFDPAIENLEKYNLINVLKDEVIHKKKKILGICLGMQLLATRSEEGDLMGLDFIPGIVKKFEFQLDSNISIPHMGWNNVGWAKKNDFTQNLEEFSKFYFVHSFYYEVDNTSNIQGETDYYGRFSSAISKENIFGVQFHPEKSHKYGIQLFKNFTGIVYA